jgi:hypothetical protein
MGFRSTFTAFDGIVEWPAWFREKYKDTIYFNDRCGISSIAEGEHYGRWKTLFEDIQKSIDWDSRKNLKNFIVIFLHECGGITRIQIEKNRIVLTEPSGWNEVDRVTHNYCVGCSDAEY